VSTHLTSDEARPATIAISLIVDIPASGEADVAPDGSFKIELPDFNRDLIVLHAFELGYKSSRIVLLA
jgi:hypothetical protein